MAQATRPTTRYERLFNSRYIVALTLLGLFAFAGGTIVKKATSSADVSAASLVSKEAPPAPVAFSLTDLEQSRRWYEEVKRAADALPPPTVRTPSGHEFTETPFNSAKTRRSYIENRCKSEIPVGQKIRWGIPVRGVDKYSLLRLKDNHSPVLIRYCHHPHDAFGGGLGRPPDEITYEEAMTIKAGDIAVIEGVLQNYSISSSGELYIGLYDYSRVELKSK